eukprot:TRINITY_DN1906_c0_g1_i6.p1 TRINITY_DN1906_c0_g1~~TRINITY_DN1906_c0_g1_i6.p1  ORF type:complete len:617 (-),score=115.92 TRINITY_DN1906_c0_g1_i6:770-2620(-)
MGFPMLYFIIVIALCVLVLVLVILVFYMFKRLRDRARVYHMPGMPMEEILVDTISPKKIKNPAVFAEEFRIDFGDIEWIELIATGSFGEVHKARWQGTLVAVKKLFNRQKFDGELLKKFEKETTMMGKLRHPNIILFMGVIMDEQHLCIVTEYMGKGSLHDVLHSPNQVMNWHLILSIAMDGARGVQYLHNFRPVIIHRDLKSHNLLVDDQYNIKVCDFGLSKFKAEDRTMTVVIGTIQWTAPEIVRDEKYTEKADIYSFGIILWELLARDTPYRDLNHLEIAIAVAFDNPPKRPPILDRTPEAYVELMTKCWSPNPEDRPSFDVILNTLRDMFHHCADYETPPRASLLQEQNDPIDGIPVMTAVEPRRFSYERRSVDMNAEALEASRAHSSAGPGTPQNDSFSSRAHTPPMSRTLISELGASRAAEIQIANDTPRSGRSFASEVPANPQQPVTPAQQPKSSWKLSMSELEIHKQIGVGSFGVVSKAIWRDTEVAVKILTNQTMGARQLEEFASEVGLMCELRHPNVVLFMGACLDVPNVCLVTEYMPKGNLYDVLHTESLVIDWVRMLSMASDAARGMNYLHCSNPVIIHRDLKSSNLLVRLRIFLFKPKQHLGK